MVDIQTLHISEETKIKILTSYKDDVKVNDNINTFFKIIPMSAISFEANKFRTITAINKLSHHKGLFRLW